MSPLHPSSLHLGHCYSIHFLADPVDPYVLQKTIQKFVSQLQKNTLGTL
ncbi:hypothetical protein RSOL_026030 [Rhizoctonia solani AG-3 Rhs1AP]|uniref:Uncharacterized protein n=1 Tax=Rhizoctonia solani AG-3 Rhs1AP TaxID=1086054 RepID=X8IW72_9AGAM|nr:hypothetical protein RSOL_026030 [Rhizoctonia solani AG-3 Rhs1AP]